MLKIGDWAKIVDFHKDFDGTIGIIIDENKEVDGGHELLFKAHRHPDRGTMSGKRWFNLEKVQPLPMQLTKQDINDSIDWALDDKDEETFYRLLEMKSNC